MNRLLAKRQGRQLRKQRIRPRIKGDTQRPRMSVFISNKNIEVQIIDDSKSKTLVSVSTNKNEKLSGDMTEKAKWAGQEIAKKAKAKKIKYVSLDRSGKLYHGRIKELSDSARSNGLEF